MPKKSVKTRFAPSPTGFLHIGGLRTALFNYLWAKKNNGVFALRIEDTDRQRGVAGAEEQILEALKLFGLDFDEGPVRQSERLPIYRKYAEELLERGLAYEEDGAIRQKIPREGITQYDDLVYKKIKVENHSLDEGVLLKSDGFPTYNFANVIDDHEMQITHVLRGEEFIPSTPKHILLYRAFGWEAPEFAHLPVIVNENGKKLSKRDDAVDALHYLQYFETGAILNFIALLGWNPKTEQEIFSKDELVASFEIKKINKSSAVFDTKKLNWLNKQWITKENLVDSNFYKNLTAIKATLGITEDNETFNIRFAEIVLARTNDFFRLNELLKTEFLFFKEPLDYEPTGLIWKETPAETIKTNLEKIYVYLEGLEFEKWDIVEMEKNLKTFITEQKMQTGEALWPLRVAVSGQKNSANPFEIIFAFSARADGREIVLGRIQAAIEKL